jgi:transcriptional regulator with XRE-family HTH domain
MTVEMIQAARALLKWRQEALAERAGIAISTLRRLEGGHATAVETKAKVQSALTTAGVVFLINGVQLRH